jgi:hypothetical protein
LVCGFGDKKFKRRGVAGFKVRNMGDVVLRVGRLKILVVRVQEIR